MAICEAPKKTERRKKPYRKSTFGCQNCKLRRVKCDEDRPRCQRCINFVVTCSYAKESRELQLQAIAEKVDSSSLLFSCSMNETILGMFNEDLRRSYRPYRRVYNQYQLRMPDLERLHRFQIRTVKAMANFVTRNAYENEIIRLVSQHPYLMHVVMTLTAMHDRLLSNPRSLGCTPLESFHWLRATALFKQELDMNIASQDKDPIWVTCALLKGICLASTDAVCPEEAWPLADDGVPPLDWVRLQDGVHAIWQLVSPLPPGSAFQQLAQYIIDRNAHPEPPQPGIEGISPAMTALYELDETSNYLNNPYQGPVRTINELLDVECNNDTIFKFFRFSANRDPGFRHLMYTKDPRALLLLAYWYAMVSTGPWFIRRRATVECQAICLYLRKFHGGHVLLQHLLLVPALKSGLSVIDIEVNPDVLLQSMI